MSFATTATPGGKSLNTQDNSRQAIPPTPYFTSMTCPLVCFMAERGRGEATLLTSNVADLYGSSTIQAGSRFFHHPNVLLAHLRGLGIPVMARRLIPDGATKSMLRLSLEIIATDIPEYDRNVDGTIKTTVDKISGASVPVVKGTVRATRGVIHVGVSAYGEENREFASGVVIPEYRDGSVQVAGKYLGEITKSDGSKGFTKSRLYPIFDILVDSEGRYGDNIGIAIETPTTNQENPVNLNNVVSNRAFPLRVTVMERKTTNHTPYPIPRLDGDVMSDSYLKPKAKDYITNQSISFANQLVTPYERKANRTTPPHWGPFGKVHVYDKNVAEVQSLLAGGYTVNVDGEDIKIVGERQYDDLAFEFGRGREFNFTDPTNNGYFNFLTARDINNTPYTTYSVNDSMLFGGTTIHRTAVHYASGGSDGLYHHVDGQAAELLNLKLLDDMMYGYLRNFGRGNDKLRDILRYPITSIIDSGWSLETKLMHASVLTARPDVYIALGTRSIADMSPLTTDIGPVYRGDTRTNDRLNSVELLNGWDWQKPLTDAEDQAIAIKLRTHFALTPESTYFNTPVMRGMIFGSHGTDIDDLYEHRLPGSVDRALAIAAFTSIAAWDGTVDYSKDDFRKPQFLKDMNYTYRDEDVADKSWDAGLNYIQAHDTTDMFWPAVQTIYPHKDSILNNAKFMLAACYCHGCGMRTWASISGENKTDEQFRQDLRNFALNDLAGKFTTDVIYDVDVVLTDADKARGYSGYLRFHVAVGSPRTKLVYSVHGYKADQLTERQGLAP